MPNTVQISIPIPRDEIFSYSFPDTCKDLVEIGKRVLVPFGNRKVLGFIVGFDPPPEGIRLKDIADVIDEEPLFDEKRLGFFRWVSNYYMCSLGSVLKAAHPGVLVTGLKRIIVLTDKGRKHLARSKSDDLTSRILNSVFLTERITAEKLFNIIEDSNFALLNSLRRRGFIEYEYEFENKARKKYTKVIYPLPNLENTAEIENKPAKRSVLEFLLRHQQAVIDDLRELFPNITTHIKWLEENGYVGVEYKEVIRDPFEEFSYYDEDIPELNSDQNAVLKKIKGSIASGEYAPYLVNGVTGSGKTEIYLRAIKNVIEKGKQAIVMVPEISLTPQLVKRFKTRFGDKVAVLHSMLSDGERFDTWRQARKGRINIVIGARSAIYTPFSNIGIIIVDEEHESSYKQDELPCYNARDLSLVLGKMTSSTVILGSATPSCESYNNSVIGKIGYLELPLRAGGRPMPEVSVIDMRKEGNPVFSGLLKSALAENFRNGNQTILFLNRRGYFSSLICENCGDIFSCPNCSIPLTYHSNGDSIKCHYCGLDEKFSNKCGKCGAVYKGLGIGTQTVEQQIKSFIPSARVYRMDRDTTGTKLKLMEIYRKLENNEVDILIGTQMVAKGHDLPGVTLVGVISADMLLGIPDFRSGERTFQLITQVAGRAGRGASPGTVIVQTFNGDHPSIQYAIEQDSVKFLENELELRDSLRYPPFTKMVNIRFTGSDESKTRDFANYISKCARSAISELAEGKLVIMGPSRCPLYRLKNKYRWQMILNSTDLRTLHALSGKLVSLANEKRGNVKVSLDVDPQNFY